MDWKRGYFADQGYTFGYYPETSPARLSWVALLKGFDVPLLGFRYLELGCGQGLNLILHAMVHLDAQFVGVDFMPEHVAHGRALATQLGLANVQFIEADFMGLYAAPADLGVFDYVVAHGISTWIAPPVREALLQLAGAVLKPGGLMYNSYNTNPGWLAMSPFQHLVKAYQQRASGQQALAQAQATLERLTAPGSPLASLLPTAIARLASMKQQDPAYLVQEYNNQHWQPVYCAEMLQLARAHKLEFMGTATLTELFDVSIPPLALAAIQAETDPLMRETVRDLAVGQSFRRDIYIKGGLRLWSVALLNRVKSARFVRIKYQPLPAADQDFKFVGGAFAVSGQRAAYQRLLDAFGDERLSVAEVGLSLSESSVSSVLQMVSLLWHGGWLLPAGDAAAASPESVQAIVRSNRTMASQCLQGAPYRYLCAGVGPAALAFSDVEMMIVGLQAAGLEGDGLTAGLVQTMAALGKRFTRDGQILTEPTEVMAFAGEQVRGFVTTKLAELQRHQIV